MAERLDVIIFGATGVTGKAAVEEGVKILSKLTWGIAGRREANLAAVLKEAGEKTGTDLSKIPIIIADVSDEESLNKMANRAKVIVNCCGPFRLYGESVIKACINAGTHHVDVSAENQYIERMQLEYDDLAKAKGVYIVGTCGIACLATEIGSLFLERHFDGQVNAIESYATSEQIVYDPNSKDSIFHYATLESIVYEIASEKELAGIRQKLFTKELPEVKPVLAERPVLHKSPGGQWAMTVNPLQRTVSERSQRYLWDNQKKRPVQFKDYITFPSLGYAVFGMFVGLFFVIFTKFAIGRKLLLTYPRFFTAGVISTEGPSEAARKNHRLTAMFYGKGWPKEEKLAEPTDQPTSPPTKTLVTSLTTIDPCYSASAVAILTAGVTILNEHTKMPDRGGVLPPGAAFANTNIIDELSKHGFKFEVISGKEQDKKEE